MNYKELIKNIPVNYLTKWFYKKPDVLSAEQTINYILDNKVSISRFGDGEIEIMAGLNLQFQTNDKKLADKLKQVKTTDKCLVCVPNIFSKKAFSRKLIKKDEYIFWRKNLIKHEYRYRKIFGKMPVLGDSFISRFYMRYNDKSKEKNEKYIALLKKLRDNRNIVFVEGENSRLGYGNDLFDNASSIKRILCPPKNAFAVYDRILNSIKKHCNKDDLIILALGPTATAMAYDLSIMGYQALDLGHIDIEYEWFLMNATSKVPIKHKHVNECNSMGNVKYAELSESYKKEIVERISIDEK